MSSTSNVRIAVYGAGSFAQKTRLPNLSRIPGVQLVAACDVDQEALERAAARFSIPRTYRDADQMLEREQPDAIYSLVRPGDRDGVEERAAARGIHLFSEKPQALSMARARSIDAAVARAGVIGTVGFRERYRPLFQEARRRLHGRRIAHARFSNVRPLPQPRPAVSDPRRSYEHTGGATVDWGVHAADYIRYLTGIELEQAQGVAHHPQTLEAPLATSMQFASAAGPTAAITFISSGSPPPAEPRFTFYYEGGYLALYMYDRLEVDGEVVFETGPFDPWYEQDRCFIEAVRTGDRGLILNDYRDGLSSLAPILAGWESMRRGGVLVDVAAFSVEREAAG